MPDLEFSLNYPHRLTALAGATLALLLLDVDAHASVANWRKTARTARINLAHQRFVAAEQGYAAALETLRQKDARAEEIFDLELLLVETYRRAGQYGKADELLNSIEPKLMRAQLADPTILVRFWRRRGELRCSEKRFAEGIACLSKATLILEKYFQRDSETVVGNYTALLRLACEHDDWQTIASVLDKLRFDDGDKQIARPTPADAHRMEAANQARQAARELISDQAAKTLASPKYTNAALYLQMMVKDKATADAVKILIDALNSAQLKKQYEKVDATIVPHLHTMLDRLSRSNNDLSLEIAGHHALACMYELRGLSEPQLAEFKKVNELGKKESGEIPFIDQYRVAHSRNRIATMSEFKPDGATDRALELLSASMKWSALPTSMHLNAADLDALRAMHIDTRICNTWAYQTLKNWTECESSLDSIDAAAYKKCSDSMKLTIVGQRLNTAAQFLRAGNLSKYQRNLALGSALLAAIPDNVEKKQQFMEYEQRVIRAGHRKPNKQKADKHGESLK